MRIKRGEDFRLSLQAKLNGVPLDLTGASIYFSVKETADSADVLFQLKNTAAGGGDTQIEVVDIDEGLLLIKGDRNNTIEIERRYCFCDCYVSISGKDYIILSEEFIVGKTLSGGAVVGGSTVPTKILIYLAEDNATLTRIAGSGWADEPVPAFDLEDTPNINIVSDEAEFTLGRTHIEITNGNISFDANGSGSSTTGLVIIKPEAGDYPFEFEVWLY